MKNVVCFVTKHDKTRVEFRLATGVKRDKATFSLNYRKVLMFTMYSQCDVVFIASVISD